jgi:hypothetical protein
MVGGLPAATWRVGGSLSAAGFSGTIFCTLCTRSHVLALHLPIFALISFIFLISFSSQRRFSFLGFKPCTPKYSESGMIQSSIVVSLLTSTNRETLSVVTRSNISGDLMNRLQTICADPRAQTQRALTTVSARLCSCVAAAVVSLILLLFHHIIFTRFIGSAHDPRYMARTHSRHRRTDQASTPPY